MNVTKPKELFPERKISETFLDFSAPLLSMIPKGAARQEYEKALKIAFVVWNAVVYADATKDERHLSEMRKLLTQDKYSRLITEEMIKRKRTLFGDDHRLVGECRITIEEGGFKLWVEARTPFPKNGNQAE